MKYIHSRDNPRYKQFLKLAGGKRGEHTMLEGIHLCQEWLQHRGLPEFALFDEQRLQRDAELQALADALPSRISASCEAGLTRHLSQVRECQGVYFLVSVPHDPLPASITQNCLWLDRIQDPGNVGTLLRTAAAAGLKEVYLSTGCAAVWSPKVLRSAQGAHFSLQLYEQLDLTQLCPGLQIPLIATTLDKAQSLYQVPLPRECAWLMGNEGQGLDDVLLASADRQVFIPQASGVESLNVAAAAAICLFEQRRQWAGS